MIQKSKNLIFLVLFFVSCASLDDRSRSLSSISSLSTTSLAKEISKRSSKVEEFKFIQKTMKKLGIKDGYLFGGTAAAWGHYVRYDMQRELGLKDYQKDRFDYAYESIFRSNQDFDFVIDGTVEQARELEELLMKEFEFFIGNKSKSVWEVRLLKDSIGDKSAILGDFDMMNQHTDSNSTGLINIGDCVEIDCVKDFRDWDVKEANFLKDLVDGKITFYHSDRHFETQRFKEGKNPEIFSVLRYYTKAVQYELKMRDKDIKRLQKILDDFDPKKTLGDDYSYRWIERNGKKLIQNAIDIEYAWNLIEKIGLRNKLINIKNDVNTQYSLSWWLDKEPLRTKKIESQGGKKAKDLLREFINKDGEIIISHETNSFPAYESITKSHDGIPNVLISREGKVGEGAAHGKGFYTKIGQEGARGTGLTIRMKLDLNSIEGKDFIYVPSENFIILTNKNAASVIVESLNLSIVEFFERLAQGLEFDFSDKAVVEKLKRRMLKSSKITKSDIRKIKKMVEENIRSGDIKIALIKEWFSLEQSKHYPELVELLMEDLSENVKLNVAQYVLSKEHWKDYPQWVELLIKDPTEYVRKYTAQYVLSKEHWKDYPQWVETLIKDPSENVRFKVAEYVLSKEHWKKHEHFKSLLKGAPFTFKNILEKINERDLNCSKFLD